jgi:hypothetical protein
LNSLPRHKAKRVFASPGPIYEIQGKDIDPVAHGARLVCRRLSQWRSDSQLFFLPLYARRLSFLRAAPASSAARFFPAAPGRPSSRCRRWPS